MADKWDINGAIGTIEAEAGDLLELAADIVVAEIVSINSQKYIGNI